MKLEREGEEHTHLLWTNTMPRGYGSILFSVGSLKRFWSVLCKDQADCGVKNKLEQEETGV